MPCADLRIQANAHGAAGREVAVLAQPRQFADVQEHAFLLSYVHLHIRHVIGGEEDVSRREPYTERKVELARRYGIDPQSGLAHDAQDSRTVVGLHCVEYVMADSVEMGVELFNLLPDHALEIGLCRRAVGFRDAYQ